MTSASAACLLAAAALIGAGCGDSSSSSSSTTSTPEPVKTVDDSAIESGMKQELSAPGADVTSVKCPSDVEAADGTTFKCTVTWSNGATGKVKVTQRGRSNYIYEPVEGSVEIPGASVEKELEAQLAKQGAPDAAVNCPDNIIIKVDTTVTCDVSGAGGKAGGSVTYTFSSVEGTIDPSSVSSS
jgi:uncharacterized protein DUF4333